MSGLVQVSPATQVRITEVSGAVASGFSPACCRLSPSLVGDTVRSRFQETACKSKAF